MSLLDAVIQTLLEEKPLDPKHRDHPLFGDYIGIGICLLARNSAGGIVGTARAWLSPFFAI
ncbi:hypothetical protein FACS1894137_16970 [Spirochaetia bacterium]|nr:hypothetical protein FACS1894137_16970 [Spirochaetia bacterium]